MEHTVIVRETYGIFRALELALGLSYEQVRRYREASKQELSGASLNTHRRYRIASCLFRFLEDYERGAISYPEMLARMYELEPAIAAHMDRQAPQHARRIKVEKRRLKIEEIIEATSVVTGVDAEDIKGPSRKRHIAQARQIAIWIAYRMRADLSLPVIGRHFGGRDHSTVLHAVRKVDRDEQLKAIALRVLSANGWRLP